MGGVTIKIQTTCYCLKVRNANNHITAFYDRMLEQSGVTIRQYSLLLNISRAESLNVRELADKSNLDRSTLARNLKPLFTKELIQDLKLPKARDSKLKLTDKGMKTLIQAQDLWEEAQGTVIKKLGYDKLAMLDIVLKELETL